MMSPMTSRRRSNPLWDTRRLTMAIMGVSGLLVQTHQLLESGFIRSLAGQILRRIVGGDASVSSRIVELHVDAVEHAGELIAALASKCPPSGEQSRDSSAPAHRWGTRRSPRQRVRMAPFSKFTIAVQQQRAVIHPAPVQAEQVAQAIGAIAALILDVVDGQHRPDRAIAGPPGRRHPSDKWESGPSASHCSGSHPARTPDGPASSPRPGRRSRSALRHPHNRTAPGRSKYCSLSRKYQVTPSFFMENRPQ